jgi:hypothetical protein
MAKVLSESGVRAVITVAVGLIGAAVGFKHTHDWASENGQKGLVAWAVAVVVECMVIVASLELRRKYGTFPLLVLIGAFVLQMAAQVSSARPTFAGWLLAATPALGFLVIVKFAIRAMHDAERVAAKPAPAPMPRKAPAPAVVRPEPVPEIAASPPLAAEESPKPTLAATWPPPQAA